MVVRAAMGLGSRIMIGDDAERIAQYAPALRGRRREIPCCRLGSLRTGLESRMLFASHCQFFKVGVPAVL